MSILTICIPTYNRINDLTYSVRITRDLIESKGLHEDVSVIISDNCSPDNTYNIITHEISSYNRVQIKIFKQDSNIGGTKNMIFTIEKAETEYCMLLGDDDYINADYLTRVVHEIKTNKNITCVFPSYQNILPDKTYIKNLGRDLDCKTRYRKKGILNCCANMKRAGQLSGLTFRKGNLVELFIEKNMDNLFPQTFFMMKNCLNGESLLLVDYPILVTHIPLSQKDWNFGDDGLLSDLFENCINLDLSVIKCSILEIVSITSIKYILRSMNYNSISKIMKDKKTTFFAGCFLLLYTPYVKLEFLIKKIYWKFRPSFLYNISQKSYAK